MPSLNIHYVLFISFLLNFFSFLLAKVWNWFLNETFFMWKNKFKWEKEGEKSELEFVPNIVPFKWYSTIFKSLLMILRESEDLSRIFSRFFHEFLIEIPNSVKFHLQNFQPLNLIFVKIKKRQNLFEKDYFTMCREKQEKIFIPISYTRWHMVWY